MWVAENASVSGVAGLAGVDERAGGVTVNAMGLGDGNLGQSGCGQGLLTLLRGYGAGDAADPARHVSAGVVVHVRAGYDIGDGESTTGSQDPGGFEHHDVLIGSKVDHTVGQHDVDAGVGQRDVLQVALDELDVRDAGIGGVTPGQVKHLGGHVEAATPPRWPGRLVGRRSRRPFLHRSRGRARFRRGPGRRRRLWGPSPHDDVSRAGEAVNPSRVDCVQGAGASSLYLYETDAGQGGKVVADRGLAHLQRGGELSYRYCSAVLREQGDDLDPGRVRQGTEPVGVAQPSSCS